MCTVSLLPQPGGCVLLMNRDEQRARASGLPPAISERGGRRVLAPSEPGGGTWVAVNDAGVAWALINWYSVPKRPLTRAVSRGEVVRTAAWTRYPAEAGEALAALPLDRIHPFRLIAAFPTQATVREWQWDNDALRTLEHPWALGHWISSGFDEPEAMRVRGETFRKDDPGVPNDGALEWLRGKHRSHEPVTGPFSICMHRADAVTVSHTEIRIQKGAIEISYQDGPPCEAGRRWHARLAG